jgi:hypothetical protein
MELYKELKNPLGEVYLHIEYSEEAAAVVVNWIGFADDEELKAGMEAGLQLLKDKGATRWVANAANMEGGFEDSNDWLEQDWTPRAQAAGLQVVAFVVSQDVFNQFSTTEYAERNADLGNPHFLSVEEALAWVKTK